MIKSNIQKLAQAQNITNPSDLVYAARIAWATSRKFMSPDANIEFVPLATLMKVASALRCKVDDLFEVVQ